MYALVILCVLPALLSFTRKDYKDVIVGTLATGPGPSTRTQSIEDLGARIEAEEAERMRADGENPLKYMVKDGILFKKNKTPVARGCKARIEQEKTADDGGEQSLVIYVTFVIKNTSETTHNIIKIRSFMAKNQRRWNTIDAMKHFVFSISFHSGIFSIHLRINATSQSWYTYQSAKYCTAKTNPSTQSSMATSSRKKITKIKPFSLP
ncbi:unnamed protein product [Cylicostephanus goldi]|uniref:Uncharacterized protein n=1 Tax=Cylicostephanus goldi TaxID=71465 RepID=A0A3P6QP15_CYLGO|nr:unnamed protein product [Cylicostephanus goldi]